ncbi:MAG: response regulator [Defluviitaleaceae bacterium]|nr:response regulator [Defluviitaleaceae bacterium]
METKLTILLVEDDPDECRAFIKCIDNHTDVHLAGVTNNADKALAECMANLPDVVILDLELHKGGGNGISFLSDMAKSGISVRPYVLVTTNNISDITHTHARRLGADFIMIKSQDGYSAEGVVDFLKSLKAVIHDSKKRSRELSGEPLSPAELKRQVSAQVNAEINLLGISPKMMGRKYLIDAIVAVINGQRKYVPDIAEKYEKSDASVERAMQHAINHTWRHADIDDLQNFYTARINSDRGVPTLNEFVFYYADKLTDQGALY